MRWHLAGIFMLGFLLSACARPGRYTQHLEDPSDTMTWHRVVSWSACTNLPLADFLTEIQRSANSQPGPQLLIRYPSISTSFNISISYRAGSAPLDEFLRHLASLSNRMLLFREHTALFAPFGGIGCGGCPIRVHGTARAQATGRPVPHVHIEMHYQDNAIGRATAHAHELTCNANGSYELSLTVACSVKSVEVPNQSFSVIRLDHQRIMLHARADGYAEIERELELSSTNFVYSLDLDFPPATPASGK